MHYRLNKTLKHNILKGILSEKSLKRMLDLDSQIEFQVIYQLSLVIGDVAYTMVTLN